VARSEDRSLPLGKPPDRWSVMSAPGTFETYRDVRVESAFEGKAENICSERVFPSLTHLRHRAH
jgi:hypothetical protein